MKIIINNDEKELGKEASKLTTNLINHSISKNGCANIILATGSSQFETLSHLVKEDTINWEKVTIFHLDEYIGLPLSHRASFRKYLIERVISKIPGAESINLIDGEVDPIEECKRLETLISQLHIDVALVGIGENCHLAFNDPPADFQTKRAFIVVKLDEKCRQQQVNEGWFNSIEQVPQRAISMSINQIMQSQHIVGSVPGIRKAKAIKDALERTVSSDYPASILQNHPNCSLFLDKGSASMLKKKQNLFISKC